MWAGFPFTSFLEWGWRWGKSPLKKIRTFAFRLRRTDWIVGCSERTAKTEGWPLLVISRLGRKAERANGTTAPSLVTVRNDEV